MAEALAVKYRPQRWEDVTGHESVLKILKQQLETNQLKHAILFAGITGAGKTTAARLLARDINKGIGEPIEINAASNNGVENVKTIIASAAERSVDGKYKIYIFDEAHALTDQAWRALLKTLEEPPAFTIFIFCTTDPQKIPEMILNRVQRYNINRLPADKIKARLDYICEQEKFINYNQSTDFIAKISDGSMRTAISNLEKASSYSHDLNISNVLNVLGSFSYDTFFKLINAIIDADQKNVFKIIDDYYNSGHDLKLFIDQFLSFCLDINKYSVFKDFSIIKIPQSLEKELVNATAIQNATSYYNYIIDKLLDMKAIIKYDTTIKETIEVLFCQLIRGK